MRAGATLSGRDLVVERDGRRILDVPELDLAGGSMVALLGPNGSGKTTLLKSLAGLIGVTGGASLDGRDVSSLPPRERGRLIAYLGQSETVHWPLPARAVVALGRFPHEDRGRDEDVVDAALAATDAAAFAGRRIDTLSGGERARVLLARALAVEAPVLIVDEPDAALDPRHQIAIFDVLAAQARGGALVIAAFHDLALAERYGDRVLLMESGRIVGDGDAQNVLTDDTVRAVFGLVADGQGRFGPRWRIARPEDAAQPPGAKSQSRPERRR